MGHECPENRHGMGHGCLVFSRDVAVDSAIRVLVLGCPELEGVLVETGVQPHLFDDPEGLLDAAPDVRARACVVCPRVLENGSALGEFIRDLRRRVPFTDVIAWLPEGSARAVREAFIHGARDAVIDRDPGAVVKRLEAVIGGQRYLPRLLEHREETGGDWEFEGMLSRSQKMQDIFEMVVRTAATGATVLILGETGTGKELLARAFHRRSERPGRMVSINCSAVPENLIDSELFGHVRGAFTGAEREKQGLFRYADGGTLFLDEVGDIPLQAQYRLLRVLQEGRVRPVGSDREHPVDVRVIAATSVRLDEAVADETFREDLLYRLDVIRVVIPPLRERPEDVLFLFGHFLRKLKEHHGLPRPEMDDSFLDALQFYDWPGNVRQLENFTERLLLAHPGEPLSAGDVPALAGLPGAADKSHAAAAQAPDLDRPLLEAVGQAAGRVEESYLRAALQRTGGRVARTAELAGISRRTLLRKLKRYGIARTAYRSAPSAGSR